MRSVASLIPYARNARTHSDAQIAQVAASIQEFGWTNPVLIDEKGGIIAGHARILAARKLRMTEAPCIVLAGLSEAQKRAYVLADNKLALNAGWDEDLLHLEMVDLKAIDFDLGLLGFSETEIEHYLAPPPTGKGKSTDIIVGAKLKDLAPTPEEFAILDGRKFMVEYSGGKDSSAAAIWTKHFFPKAEIMLCYIDLGAEYYGFSVLLQQFAEAIGCELKILRAHENVIDAFLRKNKWPVFAGPYCHEILHAPMDEFIKKDKPEDIVCVRGGRAQERAAQQGKLQESRFLVIARMKQYSYFQPIYFTSKEAAAGILKASGMPIWEGYGRGLQRTACRVCPGQRPATYAAIRANFPEVWAELVELERRMGSGAWFPTPESRVSGIRPTFTQLADRGQPAFEEGNYRQK